MSEFITQSTCTYNKEQCYKTNILPIMDKIEELKKEMVEMKILMAKMPELIFEKAEKRYAGKVVERLVYGMVGTILTAFLLSIFYLVSKQ